ncbi:MAG: LysR family transcriptional regulator [Candidimonas sp.]|nr:MAG: LysR family transcriptional regulator [Candidimonas sp.]
MSCNNFKLRLNSEWVLENPMGEVLPLAETMRLLAAIDALGHIAGACRACNVSYRHAWGVLRGAEKAFGAPLLETSRRQGTKLTLFGQRLLWASRRVDARTTPAFESMVSELQEELKGLCPDGHDYLRLHASHGFAIEGMMKIVNQIHSPSIELRYRTALEALASLEHDECDLAGFEVPEGEFEQPVLQQFAKWLDPDKYCLIHLATRNMGLFVERGNPKNIQGLSDLLNPNIRFINRQIGSCTRDLVDLMLCRLDIETSRILGYDNSEFTHMAIAAHISSGMADVGFGVETAAWRGGLSFIPLVKERYFFAVHRDRLSDPIMGQLFTLMQGGEYQSYMTHLVGYDATHLGEVQTMQEAFDDNLRGLANA